MEKFRIDEITINLDNLRKPLNSQQRKEMSKKKLYPYYGANNLMDYIDEYIFDEEILCVAEDGGSWGYKEKCSYIVNEKCWVNNHAHILKAKENLNLKYLMYYLNYNDLSNRITGTTRGKLTKSALNSIEVKLPSIEKQKKIVALLEKAQELIDKRKKQIEELDLLVKSKFIEMFGDPITNSKEWNTFELREGIKEIKYGTSKPPIFSEEGIPFVRATNIKFGRIIENDMKYISEYEAEKIEKCKLSLGDTIIVRSGANTGDNAFVSEEYVGSYGGYDIIVKLNEKINYIFLNALLNSIYRETIIQPLTRRAGQPHLNSEQIQSLVIYNPPIELQNQFADFVKQVDKLKFEMENSLKELKENFDSLIQKDFKEIKI